MSRRAAVVVEADGGSRGNPGPAAYGAVLKDARTGEVLAEVGQPIGLATNNVAEYSGLVAGLELYRDHADGAGLEVRMDSKLVVEQMSGRWRIKHPDLRPLALRAHRLAPPHTTYRWIPREQNKHADRLVNLALDGTPVAAGRPQDPVDSPTEDTPSAVLPVPPWEQGPPTTLVLVRHGQTALTRERRFSGRGGSDPGLDDDGRAQVRDTADWLAPLAGQVEVMLTSPLRRTVESAQIIAARLGLEPSIEEGLAESGFGAWDGLTYAEVAAAEPETFGTWLRTHDHAAGGHGDSLTTMHERTGKTLERLLTAHTGQTVLAVSHVTPIKLLVARALDLSLDATFRVELAPASVTVLAWYPDGHPVVRLLNGRPAQPAWT
jgi:probable phosphoglycerate mutase